MSAFALLFGAALLSLLLHRTAFLRPFVLLILGVAAYLVHLKEPVLLHGFASSSGIDLFLLVLFTVLGAYVLSQEEDINATQALFIAAAALLLLQSNTLLTFVFSFEAISIISFAIVGYINSSLQADGAVKMFISGATATGFVLFGLTLFSFGGGDFNHALTPFNQNGFTVLGVWIILLGTFYKLTIVPMHSWAAASYANIHPSSAALLSGVVKSVVVVAVFKLFSPFFLQTMAITVPVIIVLAIITMTIGNILAFFQKRVAKMLAYSSIAQAGYMVIIFIAVKSSFAATGLLYMAIAYLFMQTALFLLVDRLGNGASDLLLEEIKGLSKSNKLAALFFAIQLFSLAGVPLLAGFIAKAVGVYAVVDAGYPVVALIVLLNSTLGIGYYAWIVKHLYFDAPCESSRIVTIHTRAKVAQAVLLAGSIYFGIFAYSVFAVNF